MVNIKIPARRWNDLISAVNRNLSIDEVKPPIQSKKEAELFYSMEKELKELRKDTPNAGFLPVEVDW